MIYCLDTNNLVAVDASGRSATVGWANNSYKEFFVTSDELAVLRNNKPLSEGMWHMGFVVRGKMMHMAVHTYGLQHPVIMGGPDGVGEIKWYRNFLTRSHAFHHPKVGYVNEEEMQVILAKDCELELEMEQAAEEAARMRQRSRSRSPSQSSSRSRSRSPSSRGTSDPNLMSMQNTPRGPSYALTSTGSGNTTINVHTDKVSYLQMPLSVDEVLRMQKWVQQHKDSMPSLEVKSVTEVARPQLNILFTANDLITTNDEWQQWTFEKFFQNLLQALNLRPDEQDARLRGIKVKLDKHVFDPIPFSEITRATDHMNTVFTILTAEGACDSQQNCLLAPNDEATIACYLYNKLLKDDPKGNEGARSLFKQAIARSVGVDIEKIKTHWKSIQGFMTVFLKAFRTRVTLSKNNILLGISDADATPEKPSGSGAHTTKGNKDTSNHAQHDMIAAFSNTPAKDPCKGCGRKCQPKKCICYGHPGYNKEQKPWKDSTMGKLYATKTPNGKDPLGRQSLALNFVPNATKDDLIPISDSLKAELITKGVKFPDSGSKRPGQGEYQSHKFQIVASFETDKNDSFLRPFTLCTPQDATAITRKERQMPKVMGLIDTGAVQSSYISLQLAQKLDKLNAMKHVVNKRICTGLKHAKCTNSSIAYDIEFSFVNEHTKQEELIVIRAQVIDSRFDLIIGRPDIYAYDLCEKFPSLFSKKWTDGHNLLGNQANSQPIMKADNRATCDECTHLHEATKPIIDEPLVEKLIVSKDALLDPIEPDRDMIVDSDRPWEVDPSDNSEDRVPDENILGSEAFKARLRQILDAYEEVFRASLSSEPAKVPMFELKVDQEKWIASAAGKYPRPMSKEKEKEVERQVQKMLALKLIRPSTVSAVSHVMLAPKPGGKWRFCVDYRTLNLLSESLSWPIPNIKHMLERIGTRRAKYFGVLDLSQGFYQVPLTEQSKALTAFITWCGTYEWNRLPMGIKGAPPFFQYIMATIVLAGLLYIICELYIDDILVHAQTEDEFCTNLYREILILP
jgi:hypothetical protein